MDHQEKEFLFQNSPSFEILNLKEDARKTNQRSNG